jgi:hypothetical protein
MLFRILWIFDAVVAAIFLFFFFAGISAGTVSSFNIGLWLTILGGLAAMLAGSWFLKKKGLAWLGVIVLAFPALPALLYLLFILSMLILQPDWR